MLLANLAPQDSKKLFTLGTPGPLGVYLGPEEAPEFELAAALVAGYGKTKPGDRARVQVEGGPVLTVEALHKRHAQKYLL